MAVVASQFSELADHSPGGGTEEPGHLALDAVRRTGVVPPGRAGPVTEPSLREPRIAAVREYGDRARGSPEAARGVRRVSHEIVRAARVGAAPFPPAATCDVTGSGSTTGKVSTLRSSRRTREELRTTLVEEGREILLSEGLETGSSNLTFKRVFQRVETKTGLRITNASVIRRIWENQADFQADVLVTIARDEARRAQGSGRRVTTMLGDLDMTSAETRALALREVCRVEGNASSTAIGRSDNWQLWLGVIGMAICGAQPDLQARIKGALAEGYRSVTEFWSANFAALVGLLGFRIRHPWSMDQFSRAAIAFAEGCALRQLAGDDAEMTMRPTGPAGEDQEWSHYAIGLEALARQYLEPDPEFAPPA